MRSCGNLFPLESSAAQPEPELTLRDSTPLYNNFLDVMKDTGASKEILDFIANACLYGNYCYIDGGLELRPPPENLDLLLVSIQRVERLNQRLEQTEEEIVALRFGQKRLQL